MANKDTKNQDVEFEILENPEQIKSRLERGEAFLRQNSKVFGGILIGAIVLIAGILFFQINKQNQNKKAQAKCSRLCITLSRTARNLP